MNWPNRSRDVSRDGPTAWLRYFAGGPEFFWVADGAVVIANAAEADASVRAFAQAVPHVAIQWGDLRVDALSADAALVAGRCHESLIDRTGASTPWDGYFTGIAVRTSEGWRLRNGHWSRVR